MPKSPNKKSKEPIVLTITLPQTEGRIQQQGTIVARWGHKGQIASFVYTSNRDIANAIADIRARLTGQGPSGPSGLDVIEAGDTADETEPAPVEEAQPAISLQGTDGEIRVPASFIIADCKQPGPADLKAALTLAEKLGQKGLWDYKKPIAIEKPTATLQDLEDELIGLRQVRFKLGSHRRV